MESVGGVVGLLVDALLMDALRNDVVMFIGRVIHLLASVWGMGMLAVVCTLGTHCTEGCLLPVFKLVRLSLNCVPVLHQLFDVGPSWPESVCLCLSCLG